MAKKTKVDFDEGPYGVGTDTEEIKNMDVFEKLQETPAFQQILSDLDEDQKNHVLKESELFAGRWQKVIGAMAKVLETPEGQREFIKQLKKRSG